MGPLKPHGGSLCDNGELLVIMLDHPLLMVKQKNKTKQYKVHRQVRYVPRLDSHIVHVLFGPLYPIPLELLLVIATDESGMRTVADFARIAACAHSTLQGTTSPYGPTSCGPVQFLNPCGPCSPTSCYLVRFSLTIFSLYSCLFVSV